MKPITVCSFNLRYGTAPDGRDAWPERKARLLACLDRLAPDILATQEALDFQIGAIRDRFPHWQVAGEGRFGAVGSPRPEEPGAGEQCAIFFDHRRFRLAETWTRWLSERPTRPASRDWSRSGLPRIVTYARLTACDQDRSLDVYNTHFDWGETFHRHSLPLLHRWLGESAPSAGVLLMGDFNVDAADPLQTALTDLPLPGDRRLRDVIGERGAPAARPTRHDFTGQATERIDWLLASSDLPVIDAWTETDPIGGRYPSDHFPVLARLGSTGAGRP